SIALEAEGYKVVINERDCRHGVGLRHQCAFSRILVSPGGLSDRMRLWRIKVEQIVAKIKGMIVVKFAINLK
ncbi:hypothetical protein ACC736_38140, partial [Rhizobium ruizarguesonis]